MTQTRADSTFETILDHVLPFAGPVLVPDEGPLRAAATQLPPIPNGMLEIRLEPGNEQVDLVAGFHARQFPLFARWQKQSVSSSCSRLAQVADALTAEGSYLRKTTTGFGLEYDLIKDAAGTELPVPSIFFMPDKQKISDLNELYRYVRSLLPAALNIAPDKVLLSNTRDLLSNLGKKHVVHTVGVMLSRHRQGLRLQIQGVHSHQLEAIFATKASAKATPGLVHFIDVSKSIELPHLTCLDLAPRLLPTIGLEINISRNRSEKVLDEILDLLVEQQMCCSNKRMAIKNWTGKSTPPELPHEWREKPAYAGAAECRRLFVSIKRQVSHIKIMLNECGNVGAKIYLEFYAKAVRLE